MAVVAVAREFNCDLDLERANIYALLSALLYLPPTTEIIEIVKKCNIDNITWQQLKNNFSQAQLRDLDVEYHRLFIGVGTGELLPYCSHYLTGFLMEKPLLDLRQDMLAMGLSLNHNQKTPEDHIAGIFEIMRLIITDLQLDYNQQRKFFNQHISSWVGDFFTDLNDIKNINHYHLVAKFGTWFMQVEKQYFEYL